MKISNRLINFPVSATRKLTPYINRAKESGKKVIQLNIGDPDLKTPKVMINSLRNWELNPIRYSPSKGEKLLIEQFIIYYNSLRYTKINESNLIVTQGGSEAIMFTMFGLLNPEDEIIVFEPFYTNYATCAFYTNVKLKPVKTTIQNGFRLPNKKDINKIITAKTKMILISNPANPTGNVYTKKEIEMLIEISVKNNLFLVVDEVYRDFVFTKYKHTSLLEYFDKSSQNLVVIDSLSKRYSLCGARIGTIVSNNTEFIEKVLKLAQARLAAGLIDQMVASKMNEVETDYLFKLHIEYKKRRDFLYTKLSAIKGVVVKKPEGAFYIVASLPVKSAEKFCIWLLENFSINNETISLAPAEGFYLTKGLGVNEVRIAYVFETAILKRAISILNEGLKKYLLIGE